MERYPFLTDKSVLIYNPIDCSALDQPKLFGSEFNLGLVGMCPMVKAPHLALEILRELKEIDRRYTLFIKGKQPQEYGWLWRKSEEREYYQEFYNQTKASKFSNSIIFENYDNSVSDWFSKTGFILSTSDREGSHQSVAEGMASGAIPIIRNWQGAELLYPGRFIFKNVDEAVDLITKLKTPDNYSLESEIVKEYARTRFDQEIIIKRYEGLISEVYPSAYKAKSHENDGRYGLKLQQSPASAR
jgi:glycosyltransferase involved in cell wall biosynthesis